MLIAVPQDALHQHWPRAAAQLSEAVARNGGETMESVLRELLRGHAQLFFVVVDDAVVFTLVCRVNRFPRRTEAELWLAGGVDFNRFYPYLENLSDWARAQGATVLTLTGRPGWRKKLPDWKWTAEVLELALG
jgi:hypothetical protein